MGKIYVPITESTESRKAVTKAIAMAKEFNMEVIAICVINRELILKLERYKIFLKEESSLFADSMKKNTEKYLSYAKRKGESEGVKVTEILLEGNPFDAIIDYIKHDNEPYKIICIAKKSGGEYMKDIFSDLERKILLFAPQDVIVVGDEL